MDGASSASTRIPLSELGESLGQLRLCEPRVAEAMERSLGRQGQLTPLLCRESASGLEVIDGFKRLRAARRLGWTCLLVQVTKTTVVQAKVQLCGSNQGQGLTEIEEAWVVRSMRREDRLLQPEIGALLGRSKSWVCRRLQLAEALAEEVQVDLRLGLLGATTARELARLPRGNQVRAAQVVKERGLSTRQATTLVEGLLHAHSDAAREALLRGVRGTGDASSKRDAHGAKRPRTPADWLLCDAEEARRRCGRLHGRLVGQPLGAGHGEVVDGLRALVPVLAGLLNVLHQTLPKGQVRSCEARDEGDRESRDGSTMPGPTRRSRSTATA